MPYNTIGELRKQVVLPSLESELAEVKKYIDTPLRKRGRLPRGVRIVDIGSTHENRGTYVLDPKAPYKPFPPQIDICLIVSEEDKLDELKDRILRQSVSRGLHGHEDIKHEKFKIVGVDGNFVVVYSLITEEVAKAHPEYSYNELLQFTREQRIDARVLKLLLERYGCAARYNRGLDELTVDEMVRQKGSIEECLGFLGDVIQEPKSRVLTLEGDSANLLQNVPEYMWRRIAALVAEFKEGRLKNTPFTHNDWLAFHGNNVDLSTFIDCGPASCGTEGYQIADKVRAMLKETSRRFKIGGGFEYYVVPCLGSIERKPFTRIFASVAGENVRSNLGESVASYFCQELKKFEERK